MLGRLLERSRQVLELFRELRRPSSEQRPITFVSVAPPPRIATPPQHLHVTDALLGG